MMRARGAICTVPAQLTVDVVIYERMIAVIPKIRALENVKREAKGSVPFGLAAEGTS